MKIANWGNSLCILALSLLTAACGSQRSASFADSGAEAPITMHSEMASEEAFDENVEQFSADDSDNSTNKLGGAVSRKRITGPPGVPRASPAPREQGADELLPQDQAANALDHKKRRPLLIYDAHLGLSVFHVEENLNTIEERAIREGGYMLRRTERQIVVRVPNNGFHSFVDEVKKMGDVHQVQITAKDVTAEFQDLQIRLTNALSVRKRLTQLLARSQNVEDALSVEAQLARLTNEIELIKGRLKLLRELTAYSTITVSFSERSVDVKERVDLPFPWLNQLGLHQLLEL